MEYPYDTPNLRNNIYLVRQDVDLKNLVINRVSLPDIHSRDSRSHDSLTHL